MWVWLQNVAEKTFTDCSGQLLCGRGHKMFRRKLSRIAPANYYVGVATKCCGENFHGLLRPIIMWVWLQNVAEKTFTDCSGQLLCGRGHKMLRRKLSRIAPANYYVGVATKCCRENFHGLLRPIIMWVWLQNVPEKTFTDCSGQLLCGCGHKMLRRKLSRTVLNREKRERFLPRRFSAIRQYMILGNYMYTYFQIKLLAGFKYCFRGGLLYPLTSAMVHAHRSAKSSAEYVYRMGQTKEHVPLNT